MIAERNSPLSGSHDVREENRSEHPLPVLRMALTRQELLDMVKDCLPINRVEVVNAR